MSGDAALRKIRAWVRALTPDASDARRTFTCDGLLFLPKRQRIKTRLQGALHGYNA